MTITTDKGWKAREAGRFQEGYYKPVPWAKEPWANAYPDHFVHISRKDPALVAFTPSAERGELNQQISMKPGRYLTKFYADKLTQDQINAYTGGVRASNSRVRFLAKADEIEKAYYGTGDGTTACMSYG